MSEDSKKPIENQEMINPAAEATKVYKAVNDLPPEVTLQQNMQRKKKHKKLKRMRIAALIMAFLVLIEFIVGISGLAVIHTMVKSTPELIIEDFIGEESSKIYDDQGNLVAEVGLYLRENVSYDELPESLVDAFLSIEDSRFFTHFGFDIPRFTKAAIDNLRAGNLGSGGSTFTMQLVKNTYFSVDASTADGQGTERTRSIEYKVQQIWLAIKLEKFISKKEIFQLYLNKLNFGGNIRGIQRASEYYFGKNANELTLDESAMLAGIVNLPNSYNPYNYLDYGTTRRNEVLNLMKYHGYLNEKELALAKSIPVENLLAGDNRAQAENSEYQAYIDAVLDEVTVLTGLDPTIKGMQIYTYLNQEMQTTVEKIENGETNVLYPDELMQVAMISMNNQNGAIVAIGGGRNYDGARLLNRATMNYKQPGSSVKPLLSYALAFEYLGFSLDEILIDEPHTYPMESMVLVNANGQYAGDVTLKDAVANSLNIPAIETLEKVVDKVGRTKLSSYLQSIGFSRVNDQNFHYSYAIGGTSFETTCKELAGAHSMIINSGVYNEPHTIHKIVLTRDGKEYYPENQNKQVLSSGSAWLVAQLMANNTSSNYFNYMQLLARDYPVYAKTGTTDWGNDGVQYGIPKGQMKDKWMVASTAEYTNVVWVGYDMAIAGKQTYYTSYKSALNIPGNINKILLDTEEAVFGVPGEYVQPDDVVESTYVYGTWPHVQLEDWMGAGVSVTSLVSKTGLENQPVVTTDEYINNDGSAVLKGISAHIDQWGNLNVSWATNLGICSGGERNISLHDSWNDIEMWGACLVDLSWLVGGASYWGTVYGDDVAIMDISSENGTYTGYIGDYYGELKVCGGFSNGETASDYACTVVTYQESEGGHFDENGNWVEDYIDWNSYGYWDERGVWVGQGYWDDAGFHL